MDKEQICRYIKNRISYHSKRITTEYMGTHDFIKTELEQILKYIEKN